MKLYELKPIELNIFCFFSTSPEVFFICNRSCTIITVAKGEKKNKTHVDQTPTSTFIIQTCY